MNILITGGLGFIGSFFSERLAETGNTVRIIDNFSGHSKDAYQVLSRNKSISIFDGPQPSVKLFHDRDSEVQNLLNWIKK